jgi:hypothetical protein
LTETEELKLRLTKGGDFGCRGLELGGLEDSKQEAVATWASVIK